MNHTNEYAGQDEIGKVVERPPPDLQVECEIDVGIFAALVKAFVPGHRKPAEVPFLEHFRVAFMSFCHFISYPVCHVLLEVDAVPVERQIEL